MSKTDRAKIFIPFNPLKGFQEALREKERMIVPKADLTEDQEEELDWKINTIKIGDIISVVFYTGDHYEKITGVVSRLSMDKRILTIVNTSIPFEDIREIGR